MGVLPNGPAGLSPNIDQADAVSADGSLPGLNGLVRPAVEAMLKQRMQNSTGWQAAHQAGYEGLEPGQPMTLGILAGMAGKLLGLPPSTWPTVEAVLADLQKVPILGDLIEVFTGIEDGDLTDLGTWVNGIIDQLEAGAEAIAAVLAPVWLIGDIIEVLRGEEDGDTADLGTAIRHALQRGQEQLDLTYRGFTQGTGLSGVTQDNVEDVINANTAALASQSAAVAQLRAALGAGNPDADDFERATIGASWNVMTNAVGTLAIDNGSAKFSILDTGGSSSGECVMLRNVVAGTNSGIVSIVLNSSNEWQSLLVPLYFGAVDIWARCTNFSTFATRTGLRLRFIANDNLLAKCTVKYSYFLSGTEVWSESTDVLAPATGSTLSMQFGVGGNPRSYAASIGTKMVIEPFTPGGDTSVIDATTRRRGMGFRSEDGGFLTPPAKPGKVMQWVAEG